MKVLVTRPQRGSHGAPAAWLGANGSVTLDGANIDIYACVYIVGTFNMTGGSFTGNMGMVGSVVVYEDGKLDMSGGSITGNTRDGAASNVCLYNGRTIAITDSLTGVVGIPADNDVTSGVVAAPGGNYEITDSDLVCLKSDYGTNKVPESYESQHFQRTPALY